MDDGVELQMVQQAFRFAIDPTPRQERAFLSHAGGARFAFNWGLDRIADVLDTRSLEVGLMGEAVTPIPSHFDLCTAWTEWKDTAEWTDRETGEVSQGVPWVANNFVGTYQAALRDAAVAWKNFLSSRSGDRAGRVMGRPRFKSKDRTPPAFQVHGGTLRMLSARRVRFPRIGDVTVMSDDSTHPAMTRSRRRVGGQRHMGNRRRARQIWTMLRDAERLAVAAKSLLKDARGPMSPDTAVDLLNARVDGRARDTKLREARLRLADAESGYRTATGARKEQAARRVERHRKTLEDLKGSISELQAARIDRWTVKKLQTIEKSGQVSVVQADDLAEVYGLAASERDALRAAAFQARIIRGTVTRGADGLWWLSLTAEVPLEVRTRPTRRQIENGVVGMDLGVRDIAVLSQAPGRIRNPRFLEKALKELRVAQQRLSRCESGSRRREKARRKVGLIHADVARLREAAAHRASTRLANRFAGIAVEGWDVQKMMASGKDLPRRVRRERNRRLADAAVGTLRWQLGYKTSRAGSSLTVLEPGAATGRTCAACGQVRTKPVPPHEDVFTCDKCGRSAPRRLNTARALVRLAAGSGSPDGGSVQSRGGGVSPEALRRGGQPPLNRAARSRPPGRGQTGTPGP